jgi:hypothetical protein
MLEVHGVITPAYVEYCRRDVAATVALYERLMVEHVRHPIGLPAERAYSPASIGKAYLRIMGVRGRLGLEPAFPREVLGAGMVGYFGGRAEVRIRRTPVPVVHLDFLSMYSTVNALMGSWDIVTAKTVRPVEATAEIRRLIEQVTLDGCFGRASWRCLPALVLIEPAGDVLPTRADYVEDGQGWQIGLNPLTAREPLWYPLADVIAAKLLTGKSATVVRAIKLVPDGRQRGLRQVALRGELAVDPKTDDFFRAVIEHRIAAKGRTDLPAGDRDALVGFLKVLGSATGYGIFAEINARQTASRKREPVRVSALGEPFTQLASSIEEPGECSFPPLASCVTAGARLMLALLERLVTDAGGGYVFCDTDSMAIVASRDGELVPCPGGPHRLPDGREAIKALSWAQVETIRQRFAALSPYSEGQSILRLEDTNLDKMGRRRQLYAYAISAKRYVLYNRASDATTVIRKASEHGLGHLLNPIDPDDPDRDWIEQVWTGILHDVLGLDYARPSWFERPAVGRITASSATSLRPFVDHNARTDLAGRVKPFNFLMTAHVAPFGHPDDYPPQRFQLVAPYDRDPRTWLTTKWVDHYSGDAFPIATGWPPSPDAVHVQSYGDVVGRYATQPEPKSLGPDGRPCGRQTVGLLQRRPVEANTISIIGKEANRIEDAQAGLVHELSELLAHYQDPARDPWFTHVLPVLRTISRGHLVEVSGLAASTITRLRTGKSRPHAPHERTLTGAAVEHAREHLERWGISVPRDALAVLRRYLDEHERRRTIRECAVCMTPLANPRASYCGETCKKRAYRARLSGSILKAPRPRPAESVSRATSDPSAPAPLRRDPPPVSPRP